MPGRSGPAVGEITAGVAAGDSAAIESFYRRYFDDLYQMARGATGRDEQFSLDVVQESVLKIVRTIRRVEHEPQLRAWLKAVVQTTAYDLLRSERRRSVRELATAGRTGDQTNPDEEQLLWLREQIALLDPKLVEMIDLRYSRQWTLRRIAERFGLTVGSVDGQLRRTLTRLRQAAEE